MLREGHFRWYFPIFINTLIHLSTLFKLIDKQSSPLSFPSACAVSLAFPRRLPQVVTNYQKYFWQPQRKNAKLRQVTAQIAAHCAPTSSTFSKRQKKGSLFPGSAKLQTCDVTWRWRHHSIVCLKVNLTAQPTHTYTHTHTSKKQFCTRAQNTHVCTEIVVISTVQGLRGRKEYATTWVCLLFSRAPSMASSAMTWMMTATKLQRA